MHPVDDHTLSELQIISEARKEKSILNLFDKTTTFGGRDYLRDLLKKPKQTLQEINSFQALLKVISANPESWQIKVSRAYVSASESYFSSNIVHTMSQDAVIHWLETLVFSFRNPAEFYRIQSGLLATLKVFKGLKDTFSEIAESINNDELLCDCLFVTAFLNSVVVKMALNSPQLSNRYIFYLDYHFRKQHLPEFRRLLDIYYKLDAYTSIVKSAKEHNLNFPEFVDHKSVFSGQNLRHPLISNAIGNDFSVHTNTGICILTGANTSGKTTFLKTIGIAVYLAHLGWPVPADNLKISLFDRLFTSIHLSDDLTLGYSHFYNEVMRIKQIAECLRNGENCVVLIDELFRGTNQQDALYCCQTVIDGFSNFRNSQFVISTHLMELLENVSRKNSSSFYCFKTHVVNDDFENHFQLEKGIAIEKVGKLILKKAGIPALLGVDKQ